MALVEMPEFAERAEALLSPPQRQELLWWIAANPESGDVMPATGGVRKLRWAAPGRGKRGGVRVIYYYHNEDVPIFLLTLFPKNVRADLSRAEKERSDEVDTANRQHL